MYPDILYNLRGVDKSLAKHPQVSAIVNIIKNELKNDGKVFVRPSGTEPLIRIAVSAPSQSVCEDAVSRITETILSLQKQ